MDAQLKTLQRLFEKLQDSRTRLLHVMIQWPHVQEGKGMPPPPVPYPPHYPLNEWRRTQRMVCFSKSDAVFPGWMTEDVLIERVPSSAESAKFLEVAAAAGKLVASLAIRECNLVKKAQPGHRWLLLMHIMQSPDRLFTWDGHYFDEVDVARQEEVHQCSVVEDPVMASILMVDKLLNLGDGERTVATSGPVSLSEIKGSHESAYRTYSRAIAQRPDLAKESDRAVYDWLLVHADDSKNLPSFASWSRYLRSARAHYDVRKKNARSSRTGRSVRNSDEF